MDCMKCRKAQLEFVSFICIAEPQDFVLVQCPNCKSVDTVPKKVWYNFRDTKEEQQT